MTIGEKIRKARTDAKMTQKELAEKCGMADSAIRKYESGKITPKLDTLARIARAMGLYAADLVDADQWKNVQMGPGDAWAVDASQQSTSRESQLMQHFRSLNDDGQRVAVERVEELAQIPKYQRAQERPQDAPAGPDDKTPAEK